MSRIFHTRTKEHLTAIILFFFLSLLFFWELVFQVQWLGEDFFVQYYPTRFYASVELSKGSFPLWNPFIFSGMPFFAEIQSGLLYPFNLVLALFVKNGQLSYLVFEYQIIFHFFIGAFLMYLFLRSLDLDFTSALLGGILFVFSGFFISHAHHASIIHSAIWLPAVFYCCNQWFKQGGHWWWGCSIFLTFSLFGGHSQFTAYSLYAFTMYYFFQVYQKKTETKRYRYLFNYALVILVFFLLSLVQILPTMELMQHSARQALDFSAATKDSLPLQGLFTLLMSDLLNANYESWQLWELRGYMGVGAIMLAILGGLGRPDANRGFFCFLAILALILVLGGNTPIYELCYELIPGFKFFRGSGRFFYIFIFAMSVLAAYGFHFFIAGLKDSTGKKNAGFHKKIIFTVCLFLFAIPLALVFTQPLAVYRDHLIGYFTITVIMVIAALLNFKYLKKIPGVKLLLLAVILFDLFYYRGMHNHWKFSQDEMQNAIHNTPVAIMLKNQPEGTRFLAKNMYPAYANFGQVYRKSNLWGYNQLQLAGVARLNVNSAKVADLLGAKFIDFKNIDSLAKTRDLGPDTQTRLNFLINDQALPRAFFVNQSKVDPAFDLQKSLDSGEFDPMKTVYLDRDFPETLAEGNKFAITRYENKGDEILIGLKNDTKGFLFISEIYYPGWRVYVNDEEKEVLRANSLFRAVRIEAPSSGESPNRIRFIFQPRSFIIGGIVSAATFSAMILLFALSIFRKRSSRER